METIDEYIEYLTAQLEVEVDIHGSRTEFARNLRRLITTAHKDKEEQGEQ